MLALLPLILQLAPTIANWIGGTRAEAVTSQVAAAVTAVTGVTDPHTDAGAAAVQAALQGKPELAAALQQRLVEIAAAQHQADLDAIRSANEATVASQSSARGQTVQLAGMGSRLAWGAAIVSALVLLGLIGMGALVMTHAIPSGSENLAMGLLETVKLLAVSCVGYWCGSSFSSAQKNEALANSVPSHAVGGGLTSPLAR